MPLLPPELLFHKEFQKRSDHAQGYNVSLNFLTAGTASIRAAPSISVKPREVRTAFTETSFLGAGVVFGFFFKISSDGF